MFVWVWCVGWYVCECVLDECVSVFGLSMGCDCAHVSEWG